MTADRPPLGILNEVIRLYIEGRSESEVAKSTNLSEDKISQIFRQIGSREFKDILSYQLVTVFDKHGHDVRDEIEIRNGIRSLVDQGVYRQDSVKVMLDVNNFYHRTGLKPAIVLRALKTYCKLPPDIACSNSFFMIQKIRQAVIDLQKLEQSLVDRYQLLRRQPEPGT